MIRIQYIIALSLLCLPYSVIGQTLEESIEKAYTYQTSGKHEQAAVIIDEAVASPKGEKSEIAWHIRGFVYKDLFLENRGTEQGSKYRKTAIESLDRSIRLDKEETLAAQNRKALKFLAISYFNDASDVISEHHPERIDQAEVFYENYKDVILDLYPDTSLTDKDIEYYLAMSTAHRKIYESDRKVYDAHWYLSNEYMDKVLEIDPDSFKAHYSKGVSYYNRGAYNLERLPSVDIYDIMQIQSESMRSIESALPFMLKAHEIDPTKIEAVKGLKIIFFNLNKEEESKFYDNKLKELKEEER
jgi:hypothetical protein